MSEPGFRTSAEYDAWRRTRPLLPHVVERECSGIAATWCPIHGDCTCPHDENGPLLRFEPCIVAIAPGIYADSLRNVTVHDPKCPLHSEASTHADPV